MCITKYARNIIENLNTSIVSVNSEGKITDVNEAMVNVTGIQRKDLIGTDFFGYFTEPSLAQEVCRRVFSEGSILQYHLVLKDINGGENGCNV